MRSVKSFSKHKHNLKTVGINFPHLMLNYLELHLLVPSVRKFLVHMAVIFLHDTYAHRQTKYSNSLAAVAGID